MAALSSHGVMPKYIPRDVHTFINVCKYVYLCKFVFLNYTRCTFNLFDLTFYFESTLKFGYVTPELKCKSNIYLHLRLNKHM